MHIYIFFLSLLFLFLHANYITLTMNFKANFAWSVCLVVVVQEVLLQFCQQGLSIVFRDSVPHGRRHTTYVKYEGTDGKYSGAGQENGTGYLAPGSCRLPLAPIRVNSKGMRTGGVSREVEVR